MPERLRYILTAAFYLLMLCSLLLYFTIQFNEPRGDIDDLLYILVGKGIYRYGLLPYDFVFEHKPVLTYVIYGPLDYISKSINVFSVLSLVCIILFAAIVYFKGIKQCLPFPVVLFASTLAIFKTVGYGGNTELIYVPLQILAIALMLEASKSMALFVSSVACVVVAANINYISFVQLLPALVFCLYVSTNTVKQFVARVILFGLLTLACNALVLFAMAAFGGNVVRYLDLQRRFLSGYQIVKEDPSPTFIVIVIISILGVGTILARGGPLLRPELKKSCWALGILIVSAVVTFCLSKKFYGHYLFAVTAPLIAMILSLDYRKVQLKMLLYSVLLGLCLFDGWRFANYLLSRHVTQDLVAMYAPISRTVADEKMMSMRASIVPVYYSGVKPFQPFVMPDHVPNIFGSAEERLILL